MIDVRQKMCKQGDKPSLLAVKQGETMGQWFMSGLREIRKCCRGTERENTLPMHELKRLKKSSLETMEQPLRDEEMKKEQKSEWKEKIRMNEAKTSQEDMKTGPDLIKMESESPSERHATETGYCASCGTQEEFGLLDTDYDLDVAQLQIDTDRMVGELDVNFDWYVERPPTD